MLGAHSKLKFLLYNATKNSKVGLQLRSLPVIRLYKVGYENFFDQLDPTDESMGEILNFIIDHTTYIGFVNKRIY